MAVVELPYNRVWYQFVDFLENYGYYVLFALLLWHFALLPKLKQWFPYTIGGEMPQGRKNELDKLKKAAVTKLQNPKNKEETLIKEKATDKKAYLRPKAPYNSNDFGATIGSLNVGGGTHVFPGACRGCTS
ncbi:hypothetical protein K7432_012677 [Basidiobolus ranarum]|uniref:ATP synthase F0 subunit 8 n=1 Tax=Basidiobolus ranarum TaxID=34480 RepID=A0ABR2WKK8_9FUNG